MDDRLAIELVGLAAADAEEALRARCTGSGEDCPEALRAQLAERDQGSQLAAGPAIELADRVRERWIAEDRHDEDVSRNIPRLVGDHTQLHGRRSLRYRPAQPWGPDPREYRQRVATITWRLPRAPRRFDGGHRRSRGPPDSARRGRSRRR